MQTSDDSTASRESFQPTMPPLEDDLSATSLDWEAWVEDHPVGAILAAAAAGAGVIALMSLTPSHRAPTRSSAHAVNDASDTVARAVKRGSDSAAHDFNALREQVADLARRLMAKVPEPREISRQANGAKQEFSRHANGAGEKVRDTWSDVRDQASGVGETLRHTWNDVRDQASSMAGKLRPQVADMAERLRPQVDAATHLARENPLWAGIAVGAVGALLASRLFGHLNDD